MYTYRINSKRLGVFQRITTGALALVTAPKPKDIPSVIAFGVQQKPEVHTIGHEEDIPNLSATDKERAAIYMDKQTYTVWVEGLKKQFPIGMRVTLRQYPVMESRTIPPPVFVINDIQEIRQLVQWDSVYKQPKAIGIRGQEGGSYISTSPMNIRNLTEKEIALVDLFNKEKQEHTPETA